MDVLSEVPEPIDLARCADFRLGMLLFVPSACRVVPQVVRNVRGKSRGQRDPRRGPQHEGHVTLAAAGLARSVLASRRREHSSAQTRARCRMALPYMILTNEGAKRPPDVTGAVIRDQRRENCRKGLENSLLSCPECALAAPRNRP